MKFLQMCFICMLLTLAIPINSLAASYDEHVQIAKDHKGDLMIFPLYKADEEYQTRLVVNNVLNNASSVVYVVVKSSKLGVDVLSFYMFLGPSDSWEGYLRWDNGQPVLYSENDSMLISAEPEFASPRNPASIPLVSWDSIDTLGYINVFSVYTFYTDDAGVNLTRRPVDKKDIYKSFIGSGTIQLPYPMHGLTPYSAKYYFNTNTISGKFQIHSNKYGWSNQLNATVFKDYLTSHLPYYLTEYPLSMPSNNFLFELESALAKNRIIFPAIGIKKSFHYFTFPTRILTYSGDDSSLSIADWLGSYKGFSGRGYKPETNTWESLIVTTEGKLASFDGLDSDPFFEDLAFDVSKVLFQDIPKGTQGWFEYHFDPGPSQGRNASLQSLRYFGAPVIPLSLNFSDNDFTIAYGYHDDGLVQGGRGENLPGYYNHNPYPAVFVNPLRSQTTTFGDFITVGGDISWVRLWTGNQTTRGYVGSYVNTYSFNKYGDGWIEVTDLDSLKLDFAQYKNQVLYVLPWSATSEYDWQKFEVDFQASDQVRNSVNLDITRDTYASDIIRVENVHIGHHWLQLWIGDYVDTVYGNGWVEVRDLSSLIIPGKAFSKGDSLWVRQFSQTLGSKTGVDYGWLEFTQ